MKYRDQIVWTNIGGGGSRSQEDFKSVYTKESVKRSDSKGYYACYKPLHDVCTHTCLFVINEMEREVQGLDPADKI